MKKVTRRTFVASVSAAALTPPTVMLAADGARAMPVDTPPREARDYVFFNDAESRFIEPACERLIDPDARGPGASAIPVAGYLDQQLASPWGTGQRLYRLGPWQPGTVALGLAASSPAALFRNALQVINRGFDNCSTHFSALGPVGQLAFLRRLAAGSEVLEQVMSAAFFDLLLSMTVEGWLTVSPLAHHPRIIAWPLKGFPGAYFREAGRL